MNIFVYASTLIAFKHIPMSIHMEFLYYMWKIKHLLFSVDFITLLCQSNWLYVCSCHKSFMSDFYYRISTWVLCRAFWFFSLLLHKVAQRLVPTPKPKPCYVPICLLHWNNFLYNISHTNIYKHSKANQTGIFHCRNTLSQNKDYFKNVKIIKT